MMTGKQIRPTKKKQYEEIIDYTIYDRSAARLCSGDQRLFQRFS